MTWGFDLDVFLRERTQQASATGDADDGIAGTIGLSEGGAVGILSAPAGRADSDSSAASIPDTDLGCREDPPAVLSGKAAHELSDYWGRLPATVWGRPRGKSQRLL